MTPTFMLADSFDVSFERVNLDAPLPLGYSEAVRMATELRAMDPGRFSWPVLSLVMRLYHGFSRSPGWWSDHCRAAGAPPHPRGTAFTSSTGVRAAARRRARQSHLKTEPCGRLLVGQGDDTYDPMCVLSAGHAGVCRPA